MFINRYGPRTRARLVFYWVLGRDRPGLPQIRKANRSGLGSDLIGSPVCKGRRSRGAWKRMCTQQKQSQIQVPLPVWSTQQQQKSNHFHQPPFKLYNLERGGRLYAPRLARNICMFTYDIETSSTTGRKEGSSDVVLFLLLCCFVLHRRQPSMIVQSNVCWNEAMLFAEY